MGTQPNLFDVGDESRDLSLSQWYTPPELAAQVVEWMGFRTDARILEPSAGRGALIAPLFRSSKAFFSRLTPPGPSVVAYDLDPRNVAALSALEVPAACTLDVRHGDFLADPAPRPRCGRGFDVALLNPPYENDQDVRFVLRCLEVAPRAVAILRAAFLWGEKRWDTVWRFVEPTRIAILVNRPQFGGTENASGARSDFVVLEMTKRSRARERGQSFQPRSIEWW